jgi:hypothetical protein
MNLNSILLNGVNRYALLWALICPLFLSCRKPASTSSVPTHAQSPLMVDSREFFSLIPGPAWPTWGDVREVRVSVDDFWAGAKRTDVDVEAICTLPGWCIGSDWVSWSSGAEMVLARAPIGISMWTSGVANLGGGSYAVGCHPTGMRRTDPNRVIAVPPVGSPVSPEIEQWFTARASVEAPILGERIGDDLLIVLGDSAVRASLVEWRPEPPKVCTWDVDYCPEGIVVANRLLVRDHHNFSIELLCTPNDPLVVSTDPPAFCATCSLPSRSEHGTVVPATSFSAGPCAE